MVRERWGVDLKAWMAETMHSGIDTLARFARRLQEDLVAITPGLTHEWSNGVTEGQIHRLNSPSARAMGGLVSRCYGSVSCMRRRDVGWPTTLTAGAWHPET